MSEEGGGRRESGERERVREGGKRRAERKAEERERRGREALEKLMNELSGALLSRFLQSFLISIVSCPLLSL